jgi:ferredoxin
VDKVFLARADFALLYKALIDEGFKVIGPQEKQGTIVFDTLDTVDDLPWGKQERVGPGEYKLIDVSEQRCFSWNTGAQSFKPWLFAPSQMLWTSEETSEGFLFKAVEPSPSPLAFLGVRSCDIAALYLQDKHFMHGQFADPWYIQQRQQMCIIAVNCSQSAQTCFCVSTGDGPEANFGFDILLDELEDGYLIMSKSEQGNRILARLILKPSTPSQLQYAQEQLLAASKQMRIMPDAEHLRLLIEHLDDKQWLSIGERCLACGNCTSVCPTCFCSKQESLQVLDTNEYQQVRYWDSCFSEKYHHIAGKTKPSKINQRYRHWLLHKLVTWQEQYQRSGCVGCGRCISWCPAAIDLVEEVNSMLECNASE